MNIDCILNWLHFDYDCPPVSGKPNWSERKKESDSQQNKKEI